VLGFGLGE